MTEPTQNETQPSLEERFAKLTGYKPDASSGSAANVNISLDPATPDMTEEEVESQISRHSFGSHPLVKLIVVGAGVFFIVGAGAMLFYGITGNHGRKPKTDPTTETKPITQAGKGDNEKGELLTTLAIQSQKGQLQKLGTVQKIPHPPAIPVQKEPVTMAASPPPPVLQEPVRRVPTYEPPVHYTPPTPPTVERAIAPPPAVQKPAPKVDPYKEWKEWSMQGSFGSTQRKPKEIASAAVEDTSTSLPATQQVEKKRDILVPRVADRRELSPTDVLPNVRARAVITTPVGFADQGEARHVNAMLLDSIRNASGDIVFPAGSRLVLEIDRSEAPLVQLKPVAIDCSINGKWVEYRLPDGSLAIFSTTDKPLTATSKRVNRGGGNTLGSIFRTVGNLGGTINFPGSTVATGVFNNLPRSYGSAQATRVYTLKSGTEVSLVVMQSFSLPEAEGSTSQTKDYSPDY